MQTIHLDDRIAEGLSALAETMGLSVEQYLRNLVDRFDESPKNELTTTEFDTELRDLTFHGPTLPSDFCRADVYADHA